MSVYKKDSLLASFPAYDVLTRDPLKENGAINVTVSDILGIQKNGYYARYQCGSVVSYALEYNECPIKALKGAKKAGENLHWINQLSTCITSHVRERERIVAVAVGMLIKFEGQLFTLEEARNGNLSLTPVKE